MSAHDLYLNKRLYRTLLTVMFNRRNPCLNQAIHVMLMRRFFVVAFFSFSLLYVCVLWIRYKIDVISSNGHRSVVRMTIVFDLENVLLPSACHF